MVHHLAELKNGHLLSDRYRLERHLGRGGMGSVWLAEDEALDGLPVAVKLLLPEYAGDAAFVASLKDEAKNSMRLTHPSIVRVFNLHRDAAGDDWTYLVLKFVEGRTLKEMLADAPQGLPVDRVLAWAEQLSGALDFAHEQDVLHRDLKPSNVMVDDASDVAMLMDFGISRRIDQTMTTVSASSSAGTPAYMSPQQLHGKECTSNDIYSFAAMLYELLAGRAPFGGPDLEEQILRVEPKPVHGVPDAINAGLLAGLAKDEADRPATARALVEIMAAGAAGAAGGAGGAGGGEPAAAPAITLDPATWPEPEPSAARGRAPETGPAGIRAFAAPVVALGLAFVVGGLPAVAGPIRSALGAGPGREMVVAAGPSAPAPPSNPETVPPTFPDDGPDVVDPLWPEPIVGRSERFDEPIEPIGDSRLTERDGDGRLVWHRLILKKQVATVRRYLAHPDLDLAEICEISFGTAMHLAAESNQPKIIRLLAGAGLEVNVRNLDDETALHWAARAGALEAVQALLELGADANAVAVGGRTPLHEAAAASPVVPVELLDALLDAGADRSQRDNRSAWPVDLVLTDRPEITKKLDPEPSR